MTLRRLRRDGEALVNRDRARAKEIFERILTGKAWTAFGYIAAEADLRRGF